MINFVAIEPVAALKSDRVKPKLGFFILMLNMNMRGFTLVAGIKKEPVRANREYRRHNCFYTAARP